MFERFTFQTWVRGIALVVGVSAAAFGAAWWWATTRPAPIRRVVATDLDDDPDDEVVVLRADDRDLHRAEFLGVDLYNWVGSLVSVEDDDLRGRITARDPGSGSLHWETEKLPPPKYGYMGWLTGARAIDASGNELVVLSSENQYRDPAERFGVRCIYALEKSSGDLAWRKCPDVAGDTRTRPGSRQVSMAANESHVAVQSLRSGGAAQVPDRTVWAFDRSTGEQVARVTDSCPHVADPFLVVTEAAVVFTCSPRNERDRIEVLDLETGRHWSTAGFAPVLVGPRTGAYFAGPSAEEQGSNPETFRRFRRDGSWDDAPVGPEGTAAETERPVATNWLGIRDGEWLYFTGGASTPTTVTHRAPAEEGGIRYRWRPNDGFEIRAPSREDVPESLKGGGPLEFRYLPLLLRASLDTAAGAPGSYRLVLFDLEEGRPEWTSAPFDYSSTLDYSLLAEQNGDMLLALTKFWADGTEAEPFLLGLDGQTGQFYAAGAPNSTGGQKGSPPYSGLNYISPSQGREDWYLLTDMFGNGYWSLDLRTMEVQHGPVRMRDVRDRLERHLGGLPWSNGE